jgi:hypothetical protein
MTVSWNDTNFKKSTKTKGLDGIEEWCRAVWHPQASRDCPVDGGTMKGSLGVERDDAANCCYVGGGGDSKDYILKQELDRSLHHEVGKAGFIKDSLEQNISKLPTYVKKHVG